MKENWFDDRILGHSFSNNPTNCDQFCQAELWSCIGYCRFVQPSRECHVSQVLRHVLQLELALHLQVGDHPDVSESSFTAAQYLRQLVDCTSGIAYGEI